MKTSWVDGDIFSLNVKVGVQRLIWVPCWLWSCWEGKVRQMKSERLQWCSVVGEWRLEANITPESLCSRVLPWSLLSKPGDTTKTALLLKFQEKTQCIHDKIWQFNPSKAHHFKKDYRNLMFGKQGDPKFSHCQKYWHIDIFQY